MTVRSGLLLLVSLAAMTVVLTSCFGSGKSLSIGANISVFHLRVGECIVPPPTVKAELSTVKVVSCHEDHTQEVFALVNDPAGDNYPGATELKTFADGNCLQRYAGYVGIDYRQSSLFYTYLLPSVRSWSVDDHTVVCIITTTGKELRSSVKGSRL